MRHAHIALAATIAGLMVSATPSNAAPGATLTSPAADDGLVQKVQIFPRRYYRQYPYGAPPAVVVPHVVPVVPRGSSGEPHVRAAARGREAAEKGGIRSVDLGKVLTDLHQKPGQLRDITRPWPALRGKRQGRTQSSTY